MRSTAPRRRPAAALLVVGVLLFAAVQVPSAGASGTAAAGTGVTEVLPASTIARALKASGSVARRDGALTVERIGGTEQLAHPVPRDADRRVPAASAAIRGRGRRPAGRLRHPRPERAQPASHHRRRVGPDRVGLGPVRHVGGPDVVGRPTVIVPATSDPARRSDAGDAGALRGHPARLRLRRPGVPAQRPGRQGGDHRPTCTSPRGCRTGPIPSCCSCTAITPHATRATAWNYRWPCKDTWKPLPNYAGYDYVAGSSRELRVRGGVRERERRQRPGQRRRRQRHAAARRAARGAPRPVAAVVHGGRRSVRDAVRRQGRHDRDRHDGPLARRRRCGLAGHRRPGAPRPLRDRRRVAAGAGGLHARHDQRRAAGRDAAVLRRRRLRPAGHPLLSTTPGTWWTAIASPKHAITVFGANHNFFNTVWTPSSGYPGCLRRRAQRMPRPAPSRRGASRGQRLHRRLLPSLPGR